MSKRVEHIAEVKSSSVESVLEHRGQHMVNYDIGHYSIRPDDVPGKYLIFNHTHFDRPQLQPRKDVEHDVEIICHTFDQLGFKGQIYQDLLKEELKNKLQLAFKSDFTECGSLIVFILTYGTGDSRVWAKDKCYTVKSLVLPLMTSSGPSLVGKPKVFIVQAYEGESNDNQLSAVYSDTHWPRQHTIVPALADLLLVFAARPGYRPQSEYSRGTCFIQMLCHTISVESGRCDLESMLGVVRRAMASHRACEACIEKWQRSITDHSFHIDIEPEITNNASKKTMKDAVRTLVSISHHSCGISEELSIASGQWTPSEDQSEQTNRDKDMKMESIGEFSRMYDAAHGSPVHVEPPARSVNHHSTVRMNRTNTPVSISSMIKRFYLTKEAHQWQCS